MPFQFQWLCELLDDLHKNLHRRTLTTARVQNHEHQLIYNWYQRYSHRIDRTGPSAVAFLSCVLPERRPDRTYNLREKRLSQIFGRALCLGAGRAAELNSWQNQDGVDFATCVERILKQCENDRPAPGKEVTLEEIDEALDLVAAHALSSSPAIRAKLTNATPTEVLGPILRRLRSTEAKWLIRMLLKTYAPVQVPEYQALHGFHFMLPNLMVLQNSFDAAIAVLDKKEIRQLPARPEKNYELALHSLVAEHVQPRLGVMIRRQPYHKARSIKNCCDLANGRQMSVERKYDGEYCQVHVDLSRGYDCIQIFSKSGRDSTSDRIRLHGALKDALRIDRNGCRIRKQCVIEGELLVWNVSKRQIQPFHKIRKYVKHGGREIGTARDSPSRPEEHLMIAFYDILVLDDRMLLNEPHKVRRQYLKAVLQTMEGRAILCEREILDFRVKGAGRKLRETFANAITRRWEGLVLKGLQEPYFAWNNQKHGIKLKKDYIAGLGDSADLCIVGGRRDPQVELDIGLGKLRWTSFYVGAVTNLDAVRRFDTKPRIKIIDILTHHSMPNSELLDLNRLGQLVQFEYASEIDHFVVEMDRFDLAKPTALFKEPFIVEIMGAGFEKLSNSSFFTLRFPRKIGGKVKLHTDRTLLDTMSFSELQSMAEQSIEVPSDHDSQEDARWIEQLIKADARRRCTQSFSQGSSFAKTITSASAVSLSPIVAGTKSHPQINIRPDTEEPETQSQSISVSVASYNITCTQQITSLTSAKAQYTHHSSKRRQSDVLTIMQNDKLQRKKQRLSIERSSEEVASSTSSDTVIVSATSVSNRRMTDAGRDARYHDGSIEVITVDAFEPPAEFLSSQNIKSLVETIEESLGEESLLTPDSTLLMRQILSVPNYHDDDLPNNSLSKNSSNKKSFVPTSAAKQTSNQHQHINVCFPFTPPISSPATKSTEQQLSLKSKTVQKRPETAKHVLKGTMAKDGNTATHNDQTASDSISHHSDTEQTTSVIEPHQSVPMPRHEPGSILLLMPDSTPSSSLSKTDASFNFSTTRFLKQLDTDAVNQSSTSPNYHIVIVTSHLLEQAADAFEALARETQAHLKAQCSDNQTLDLASELAEYNANSRVLVFDHRVLEHVSIARNGGKLDFDVLKSLRYDRGHGEDAELFCGVLVFYEITGGEAAGGLKVGIDLKYIFDWLNEV